MQSEEKKLAIIQDIGRSIVWFDKHAESDNLLVLSEKLVKLQTQSATLAQEVVNAYSLMNESEDLYKEAVDKFVASYDGSIAAAEPRAREAASELKKNWTAAKNAYKRLDTILDRVDKISDAIRQRVSVVKQSEMKNL